MIGIYKITSPTGKVYIGQSVDIEKRLRDYKNRKGPKQPRLNRSFLKYGYNSHKIEVLEECLESELNDRERYYQDLFDCIGENGLNCSLTKSTNKSGKLSIEQRKKISESCKNKPQEVRDKLSLLFKGKKRPKEVGLKISAATTGRKLSKEHVMKISENSRNISEETRQKYRDSHLGNIQSEETRKKISNTLKGHILSEESKLKIAEKHGFKVVNTETGEEFLSVAKAAKHYGCNIGHLHNKLKGIAKNNTNLKYA